LAYVTVRGTTFGISTTVPASTVDTAGEFAALTYTTVGGMRTLGEFGDESQLVKFEVIGDGRTRQLAGSKDAGVLECLCAYDAADAGQLAMIAAFDAGNEYAFKVSPNDGASTDSIWYFIGPVTSKRVVAGENNSVLSIRFNVAVNSAVVHVAAT
jgi:Phage tail tube protein, TTP